jgi:hypothetical protein
MCQPEGNENQCELLKFENYGENIFLASCVSILRFLPLNVMAVIVIIWVYVMYVPAYLLINIIWLILSDVGWLKVTILILYLVMNFFKIEIILFF